MRPITALAAATLAGLCAACASTSTSHTIPPVPASAVKPVSDSYHGQTVVDDYRWLEDWSDPSVQAWAKAQNDLTRAHLDSLPSRKAIASRLTDLMSAKIVRHYDVYWVRGQVFAMKDAPPREHPFLVVMDSVDSPDSARTLLDPGEMDKDGLSAIDWFVPSHDGSKVAVSISRAGTEAGDLYIVDTSSTKVDGPIITRVNGGTAGGSLSWDADDKGFFYTRYPRESERTGDDLNFFVQVYHHTLGDDPAKDRYELGSDFPKIAEIELKTHQPSGRVIATVQDGDGGDFAHFIRNADNGQWTRIANFKDGIKQAYFGEDDAIFLISRSGAPRGKVLVTHAANPSAASSMEFIPQGEDSIVSNFWGPPSLLWAHNHLFVEYQTGGPSEIRVFDETGTRVTGPKLLDVSSAGSMTATDTGVVFANGSFTNRTGWYHFNPQTGATSPTGMVPEAPADMSDYQVVREFAISKDGTKVPVNIIIPPGVKMDGSSPCLVNAYGGYGVNIEPALRTTNIDLLEQGVICAIANIRGGGEYGEEWHKAGNLTKKQNVFDDFAAACEHMIDRGCTSHEKLAIIGGSNGGLLMGATFTQHPDLAKAVVSYVGIYDMLRVELSPNGAFNIPEFGTVTNPDHFRALYAYSPYHHVSKTTQYPAILFTTGVNDPRVEAWQSFKMTAALQATATTEPVLLKTSLDSGHGGGVSLTERINEQTDVHAFLYDELGVQYKKK